MNGGGHQTEHQTDGRMEASGWIASVRIAGDDAAVQALRLVLEDAALVLHVLQGALADHESISAICRDRNETEHFHQFHETRLLSRFKRTILWAMLFAFV